MTNDEFALWQTRTEGSRFKWTEDEIFRLNGRGAFYYTGGDDGIYIKIHKHGLLEIGSYEGAVPHIGEALYKVKFQRQCADYSSAFTAALEAAGKQFLVDVLTQDSPAAPDAAESEKTSVITRIKAVQGTTRSPNQRDAKKSMRNSQSHIDWQ